MTHEEQQARDARGYLQEAIAAARQHGIGEGAINAAMVQIMALRRDRDPDRQDPHKAGNPPCP